MSATANGVDLGIQIDTLQIDTETIGEPGVRAADGSLRDNVQNQLVNFVGLTTILPQGEALFLRALLLRQRDAWRWATDLYSDKGLGPSSSSGTTVGAGSGGELDLSGSTGTVTYPTRLLSSGYTLAVAVDPDGSGFHDYIIVWSADGLLAAVYKDGSAVGGGPTLPEWITTPSGIRTSFLLGSGTSHIHKFSDLETISAALQESQVAGLTAFRALYSKCQGADGLPIGPNLLIEGTVWPLALTMQGNAGSGGGGSSTTASASTMSAGMVGGAFATNNLPLSFSLRQVV